MSEQVTIPAPHEERDFLEVARELRLVAAETADQLAAEARTRGVLASQLVMQKGLLTPTQIDIVETLRSPREAVPGYQTLGLIGHGGMGVVYRARQVTLDRVVALKTVLVSQLADASATRRFEQEATLAARLAHPHIVTAYDFGRHEGRLFFAMELVEGEDAERLVRRTGGLDEQLAWSLIRQTAAGLAHAQQVGIIHRDIKPANLLLVKPPAGFPLPAGVPLVKIADFGLARLAEDDLERTRLTSASAAVGSPLYMAPEQLRAETVDQRTDIYALGATAYHLLAGKAPLAGKTISQIMALKLSGQIPELHEIRPEVSAASAELVAALMALEPENRPADYVEVIRRIDAVLGAEGASGGGSWSAGADGIAVSAAPTITLQTESTQTNLPPVAGRRWMLASLLIVGGLVLASIPATLWLRTARSPGRPDLMPTGRGAPLFEGQTINDWLPHTGGWSRAADSEGAPVIEGEGVIRRVLALPGADGRPQPVRHYRLIVHVRLHEASAVEVQFDLSDSGPQAARQALRITRDGAQLATRKSNSGPSRTLGRVIPPVTAADGQHVVQIERHTRGWWVWYDDQFVGAVRGLHASPAAEFRLAAEGGLAWFSDIGVEELVVTPQESH